MTKLARRTGKVIFFLLILFIVGHAIGEPYSWLNYDFVLKVGQLIYGYGEIGAEAIDDTYFYIVFMIAIIITVIIYFVAMKLLKLLKKPKKTNN
jgi:heme/copper-type cytochrome/quinol oxidase subunit 2